MISSFALLFGIFLAVIGVKNPLTKYKSITLQISIILMGFGMNLNQVISASKSGFLYTAISVVSVITVGLILGKLFKIEKNTALLISGGTAICGGSAIAAISSVIGAKDNEISFSLIVVFVLNAVALFLFPVIGHFLKLDQTTFGNWAAIAIHDTSSVVGAGAVYGDIALEVATTVKLIRALWIIPVSLIIAVFNKNSGKIKIPWFILYFVIAIVIAYLFPTGKQFYFILNKIGKLGMILSLFLIGSGFHISNIKDAGIKSFIHGITLWILTGSLSFIALCI